MTDIHYFTVSQANSYLAEIIESEPILSSIWISGEISSLKSYAMGQQIYFNLVDETAQLNCVIYASTAQALKQPCKNGDHVLVKGKLTYFKKKGSLVFQVFAVQKKGLGTLSEAFEKLKQQCLKEGLFDPKNKQPLPSFPTKIGVITSPDSAAQWDFVSHIKKRAPHISVLIFSSVMQGPLCSQSVIEALEEACKHKLDMCVITRGGGSMEDLWGFNDETLVRAIAACSMPVASAIGHEVDYTLTDFVADVRYPTPTAAAIGLTQEYISLKERVSELLQHSKETVDHAYITLLNTAQTALDRSKLRVGSRFQLLQAHTEALLHRVKLANPLHKLSQGYSIARLKNNASVISSYTQVSSGDLVDIQTKDGYFSAQCL
jgi:exodeoxyribonuclease VII large subunit